MRDPGNEVRDDIGMRILVGDATRAMQKIFNSKSGIVCEKS